MKEIGMIREATYEDASSLAAISLEVWLNTYLRNGVNAFFSDYALERFTTARYKEILSRSSERIWVSQNSEGIDGFIRVILGSITPVTAYSDTEIQTLFVQPRHQGKQAGPRLLDAAYRFCAQTGRPDVWLTVNAENERAIKFYLRNGFEKIGEIQFRIGDQAYPNHVLRLPILPPSISMR